MSSLPCSLFCRVAEAGLPHGVVLATFPSMAAAFCSQILQPFLVQDLSQEVQMVVSPGMGCSPAALGQMRWEAVRSGRHGASVSCSAEAARMEPVLSPGSHGGFCCVRRACATRQGVERSFDSLEEKTGWSARQKCKSPFRPNSPGFLSVWMEHFGFQGQMSLMPGLGDEELTIAARWGPKGRIPASILGLAQARV